MTPSDADIDMHLQAILRSKEFSPDAGEAVGTWVATHLRDFFEGLSHMGISFRFVVGGAGAIGIVIMAMHVWRAYQKVQAPRRARHLSGAPPDAPERVSPAGLMSHARHLAHEGLVRDAARTLQQALFVQQCQARGVPWRPTVADWEWIALLHPPAPVVELTRMIQHIAFGPEPTRVAFEACMEQAKATLEAVRVAASGGPS